MATTITKTENLVGKRIRRREDPRLITGTATYVDDIKMPGMHHACIRAQPARGGEDPVDQHQAGARISRASRRCSPARTPKTWDRCRAARRCPACACRITTFWRSTACTSSDIRSRWWWRPIATSRATRPIWSKWITNRCPPSPIPRKRSPPGAPAVHPEWPDNTAFTFHQEGGEVDKAFAEAEVVVKQRITSQRLIPTAMETRGVVADWRGADQHLTLYSSTQIPHLVRTLVAQMLGLDENRLRVVTPGSRRRLRQQAERLRRRSADGLRRDEDRQAGEVDRIAAREFPVHHSRPRPRGLLRSRGQDATAPFSASS